MGTTWCKLCLWVLVTAYALLGQPLDTLLRQLQKVCSIIELAIHDYEIVEVSQQLDHCNLSFYFVQTNFQAVLVTDKDISFALYLYDEDDNLESIIGSFMTGFTAADSRRYLEIRSRYQEQVFRIDGNLHMKLFNQ